VPCWNCRRMFNRNRMGQLFCSALCRTTYRRQQAQKAGLYPGWNGGFTTQLAQFRAGPVEFTVHVTKHGNVGVYYTWNG
jgi:hypothetical protein